MEQKDRDHGKQERQSRIAPEPIRKIALDVKSTKQLRTLCAQLGYHPGLGLKCVYGCQREKTILTVDSLVEQPPDLFTACISLSREEADAKVTPFTSSMIWAYM